MSRLSTKQRRARARRRRGYRLREAARGGYLFLRWFPLVARAFAAVFDSRAARRGEEAR